jgi:hypothetical protein
MVQSLECRDSGLMKEPEIHSAKENAVIGSKLGKWLPLLFAMIIAIDGWVTQGSLAQSTAMVAALFRRLRVMKTPNEIRPRFANGEGELT